MSKSLGDILKEKQDKDGAKYVNHEFQTYGAWLADQLDAPDGKYSLFIKLAKEQDRDVLERSLSFVKEVENPKNKVALFLWKMKKINEEKNKEEDSKKK